MSQDATEQRREERLRVTLATARDAEYRSRLGEVAGFRRSAEAEAAACDSELSRLAALRDVDAVAALVPRRDALLLVAAAARQAEDAALSEAQTVSQRTAYSDSQATAERAEYARQRATAIPTIRQLDARLRSKPRWNPPQSEVLRAAEKSGRDFWMVEREMADEMTAREIEKLKAERARLIETYSLKLYDVYTFAEVRLHPEVQKGFKS